MANLVAPHGGVLINRVLPEDQAAAQLALLLPEDATDAATARACGGGTARV